MNEIEFQEHACRLFKFLEVEYALQSAKTESTDPMYFSIGYSNKTVLLEVFLDQRNGNEVGVLVGKNGRESYSLHTYIQLVDYEAACAFGFAIATNDTEIIELLAMFASALQQFGRQLISGSDKEFRRIKMAEEEGYGLKPYSPSGFRFTGED